ncbi:hypothetical protein BH23ACI1_BH23ACI1_03770 [soil metagenome]
MRFALTAALLAVAVSACAPPAARVERPGAAARLPDTLRVQVREGSTLLVRRVPFEEYVQVTILSEFAPAAGEAAVVARMYDLQAVISRTYAAAHPRRHAQDGFDLCSTTHCQVFEPARLRTSRWAGAARDAVSRTAGLVVWFGQAPATALFHADCGGRTSDATTVWGGAAPSYLRGVTDDGPAVSAHATWRYEAGREAVRAALNAHPPTAVGARLVAIEVVQRDQARRIQRLRLKGEYERIVRGEDFRTALTRAFGARSVRSTRFDIRALGDTLVLEGHGFGHGVGLCQAGAFARVRAGEPLRDILQRYYPGTTLRTAP